MRNEPLRSAVPEPAAEDPALFGRDTERIDRTPNRLESRERQPHPSERTFSDRLAEAMHLMREDD